MSIPLTITDVALYERGVRMRLPFRFGVVTLTACPQTFVRVRIRTADGREAEGASAELLAPKWFDKNLALSNEDNFEQLRTSLRLARTAYLREPAARDAFGHFSAHYQAQIDQAARQGLNPLIACFGPAQIDKAVLDALCRAQAVTFTQALQRNMPGIDARLTPDLADFDLNAYLADLHPAADIALRHTVGLVDPITAEDLSQRLGDGLPETLEEVLDATGCRCFKLKVAGDAEADIARLVRIARVLDRLDDYQVTLDGNEQFADARACADFWQRVEANPALTRLAKATLYIEQPLPRAVALDSDVHPLAAMRPVLIDESDATLDAFPRALACGYTGVSSKACKGLYRSVLNAARCARLNGEARRQGHEPVYFMSAEDLTTQAGLAVQQDLALVNLLGLHHVERNGHHYVDGFGSAPAAEAQAFQHAHPDLYQPAVHPRLRVQDGRLALHSLQHAHGFGTAAHPDWNALQALPGTAPSP